MYKSKTEEKAEVAVGCGILLFILLYFCLYIGGGIFLLWLLYKVAQHFGVV